MSEPREVSSPGGRWPWLVAILVVAGLAVGAFFFFGRGAPATPEAIPSPSPSPSAPSAPAASVSPAPSRTVAASTPAVQPSSPTARPTKSANDEPLAELDPVDLGSDSERVGGVVVSLENIESVQGVATIPGDVAGPALRLTILVRNGGSADVSLDTVVVNGYRDSDRTPLESLVEPGGKPFGGTVAPGGEAQGVYIFRVGSSQRADVTFTVDLHAGEPASVFRGDAR
jgi:hypothetical protein